MAEIVPILNRTPVQIRSALSGGKGYKREAWEYLLSSTTVKLGPYEFLGDAVPGELSADTDGTAAAAPAIDAGVNNGRVVLDPGTDDDGKSVLVGGGLNFKGDNNVVMECHFTIADITPAKVEVGLTDALTETGGAGIVDGLGANTFTATSAAALVLDTDDTAYFQFVGNKAGTPATKVEPFSASLVHPSADGASYALVLATRGDEVRFILWDGAGALIHDTGWNVDFIEGGTLVTPWILAQNRDDNDNAYVYVDYLHAWQSRY